MDTENKSKSVKVHRFIYIIIYLVIPLLFMFAGFGYFGYADSADPPPYVDDLSCNKVVVLWHGTNKSDKIGWVSIEDRRGAHYQIVFLKWVSYSQNVNTFIGYPFMPPKVDEELYYVQRGIMEDGPPTGFVEIESIPYGAWIMCYGKYVPLLAIGGRQRQSGGLQSAYPYPYPPPPPFFFFWSSRPTPTYAPTACGPEPDKCAATPTPITIIIGPLINGH